MSAGDKHAMRKAKKPIVGKPDFAGLSDFLTVLMQAKTLLCAEWV
jgi:hypothetical protein